MTACSAHLKGDFFDAPLSEDRSMDSVCCSDFRHFPCFAYHRPADPIVVAAFQPFGAWIEMAVVAKRRFRVVLGQIWLVP